MKFVVRALMLVGGLLVVVAAGLGFAVASSIVKPARTVGLQVVSAPDSDGHPITTVVYYPAQGAPALTWLGMTPALLARDAPVTGGRHPLILISHGTAGSPSSHLDTAVALAERGFIVAAMVHNGDNYRDQSAVGTVDWISDRARNVVRVADFMLGDWPARASIDADRVGVFGFSAGATTALVNIGASPDFSLVPQACARDPEFVCQILQPGTTLANPTAEQAHDPRIRAALLAAPGFGMAFTAEALAEVGVPVELWVGASDTSTPAPTNAAAIAERLPARPSVRVVDGAGHFSFLAPCGAMKAVLPPMLCADAAGFDRAAFHRAFNAEAVAFFSRTLDYAEAEQPT